MIPVNTNIICDNAPVNFELKCNDITATGEVHVASIFIICAEMILPLEAPTVMSVVEGSCYYDATTGNLLISKDGQTSQTPTLHCVVAKAANVDPAGTIIFDTIAGEFHILDGT